MNNDLATFFGGQAFQPATVEPAVDYEAVPPEKYPVLIGKAEVKQTKNETGHYLELTETILDGTYKNRKIWDRINIDNPSTQCVEIGMRSLSALGRALGIAAITDSDQLLNQTVIAHVKVKDGQNYVRTYSSATAPTTAGVMAPVAPPAGVPSGPPVASQIPQGSQPPQLPWERPAS